MRVVTLALIAVVLAACGESAPPGGGSPEAGLPLTRGFYVMNDIACADASNATLLLVHSGGVNGSRDACEFRSIAQTGPTSYRAVTTCRDIQGRSTEVSTQLYEIPEPTTFSYGMEGSDYRSHFRYCAQASLPDPWRDIDLSD